MKKIGFGCILGLSAMMWHECFHLAYLLLLQCMLMSVRGKHLPCSGPSREFLPSKATIKGPSRKEETMKCPGCLVRGFNFLKKKCLKVSQISKHHVNCWGHGWVA